MYKNDSSVSFYFVEQNTRACTRTNVLLPFSPPFVIATFVCFRSFIRLPSLVFSFVFLRFFFYFVSFLFQLFLSRETPRSNVFAR